MHSQSDTSLSLLQRACSNDQIAWARICDLYGPLIYSQCRTAGIQPPDVEDIFQNVLISVQRRLAEFRKTEKNHTFRGWLYIITRNEIINFFRVRAKEGGPEGGSENLRRIERIPVELPSDSSMTQGIDPVLLRALEIVRTEFDERTWRVFTRFKIDNVPAKEVAAEFGTTDNNVRQIAFRVRKRLDADFDGLVEFQE